MKNCLFYIYNFAAVPLIYSGFLIASLFNQKIRNGIKGRKKLFPDLEKILLKFENRTPRIWIHNSSMGEFEQAKPVIDAIKKQCPKAFVLVTFFSPSGFDHAQNTSQADYLCYLPFDSARNARKFISWIKPDLAMVIRHDFWPNYLWALKKMGIPSFLINASIGTGLRYKIKPIVKLERSLYHCFSNVFVISDLMKKRCELLNYNKNSVTVTGDTRYDQVINRAKSDREWLKPFLQFKNNRLCVVLGSTWPKDESVIFQALSQIEKIQEKIWIIAVPHEPTEEHIENIRKKIQALGWQSIRLSQLEPPGNTFDEAALIVDKVGVLANLYALADFAYVGGGFGAGVHSVLEPAAFGKIVIYGPNHHSSFEALQMKKRGFGFSIENAEELKKLLIAFLNDPEKLAQTGLKAKNMVEQNRGAARTIVHHLFKNLETHVDC